MSKFWSFTDVVTYPFRWISSISAGDAKAAPSFEHSWYASSYVQAYGWEPLIGKIPENAWRFKQN